MYMTSIFKKSTIEVIPEYALNHPLVYKDEMILVESNLFYQEQDLI